MDIVKRIHTFNAGRDAERLAMKYQRMRNSPFGFLRATCHLFYDRLSRADMASASPRVWLCGDLHLENFGSYKGDNRLSYFDINDFDEAVLAPAAWDLLRFLTSLQVAAPTLGVSAQETTALCERFLTQYSDALVLGKSRWIERDTAQGAVGDLLTSLRERKRVDFLSSRTQGNGPKRRLRLDSGKALAASDKQQSKVARFMATFAQSQPNPDFYQVLDIARRVAGTGSLGLARYVILVAGKGSPDGNYLLDLKESRPSSLQPHLQHTQPAWESEAHRIVAVQRRVQAVSMAFLHPVMLGRKPYVLRALQASEDRIDLRRVHQNGQGLPQVIDAMAHLMAWGQLRSGGWSGSAISDELGAFGRKKGWRTQLLKAKAATTEQVQRDWASYCRAFDAGEFNTEGSGSRDMAQAPQTAPK